MEGGDELLNSEPCPSCGEVVYWEQVKEWIDQKKGIAKCPKCGKEVKIE